MAHSYPNTVELTHRYNKVIKIGKSNVPYLGGMASRERATFVNVDGQVLDKPIQVYRMWYRFLQLALELEEKKVQIVSRMFSVPLKKPTKDRWGNIRNFEMKPVLQKVKVNRKVYKSWNLDIVPTTSFDVWWKGSSDISAHRELFYPDTSVKVMKKGEEILKDDNHLYLRIDKRRRINDLVNDLRMLIGQQDRAIESVSDFPVLGTPNINTLINRYNALILQLTTTLKDKEILASGIMRATKEGMGDHDEDEGGVYKIPSSPGRAMRDLVLPAKITVLSVADGYFVENPNKDYL
jgi:hypothetical protein